MIVINIDKAKAIAIKQAEQIKDMQAKEAKVQAIAQAATVQELEDIVKSIAA